MDASSESMRSHLLSMRSRRDGLPLFVFLRLLIILCGFARDNEPLLYSVGYEKAVPQRARRNIYLMKSTLTGRKSLLEESGGTLSDTPGGL